MLIKLIMPAVTRKMVDLKNEILAKVDEKFREFKSDFINEVKDQIKNQVNEAIVDRYVSESKVFLLL